MPNVEGPVQANQGWKTMCILFYTTFLTIALGIKVMLIINDAPSTAINTIVSATLIRALNLARDKPFVALAGIVGAIAMDLVDNYMETNILTFVSCLVVAVHGMGICTFALVTSHYRETAGQDSTGLKLFAVMSFILKLLLKNDIIPVVAKDWHNTQDALFVASFTWSILALWLQATGIPILNPVRRTFYDFERANWSSLTSSILYWAAGILVIVNVMITVAVSSAGTPIVAKVAGIVFGACTTAVICMFPDD